MKKVRLRLSSSYDVHIGPGMLTQTGHWLMESGLSDRAVIITNPIVKELYGEALEQNLAREGFEAVTLQVPDGEEQKSLDTATSLYHELSKCYAERTTPIIALGGGVIGDLAGFVAATYLRGVPLVQIPTTLLAQVDSSIGGKVAVNHDQLKNKIGAFYQPKLVISDISTLKTLPDKEFANGLAEVIKSAVVWDREFFTYLEMNLDSLKALSDRELEEAVFRSVKIKAEVVEKDEKDLGLRSILNYGHTIGHAIETAADFGIGHGEAIAIGMIAAARISNRMGILDIKELNRLTDFIRRADLMIETPRLALERIIQAVRHDKKVMAGKIRFVLPKAIGDVFITDKVEPSLMEQVLVGFNEES
ncbi:MAG: 3-dehydroquinate synthase [Dehalococcoidia bacterium]|nr:MAG: 3-dehydroquinate synthase [Dehalococcoidia bacterium]